MERITLSNATFEGANNVYLFADGPETVLIDTGDWMDATRKQLKEGLSTHGVDISDIDRIFLTHWHQDHTGLAEEIQAESGASVHVHTSDAALVEEDGEAWAAFRDKQRSRFDEWHIPEDKQAELEEILLSVYQLDGDLTVEPFEDGDVFSVNGHELTVVHAPGHAEGLCLFEVPLDGRHDVLCSDALLPVYTPNVGGADIRVENALKKYLRTLEAIATADYDRGWPGHRDPIDDTTARAEEIIHHHEERAHRIVETLAERGPCDVWTISAELFGELEDIHIIHGPGEVYAHLEHLQEAGTVLEEEGTYRLASGVSRELDDYDDGRWPLSF